MSWATFDRSHNFCWSASMSMPILSDITAAALKGKEEVGLPRGCLPCPTPCTNEESRGACPKTSQAKRAEEAEWRSRPLEEQRQLLWHAEQQSGMVRIRCLVPWYSSETWPRLDFTKIHPVRHRVQCTVEMIIPLADTAVVFASLWPCHSFSSFSVSNKSQPFPLAFLLAQCSFLISPSALQEQMTGSLFHLKCKKDFWAAFWTRMSLHVFISLWFATCSWTPDGIPFSCDSFTSLMKQRAGWSDHVSDLCMPMWPWVSPSMSGDTLCFPGSQQSFSSLDLKTLTSVSHSWKEIAWHPRPL